MRAVEAYLDAVIGNLPAGRRARAAIRAELADGLACAVEARVERGATPEAAAAEAVAEFGPPRVVAREFARELLAGSAHRIGLGLLCGGPLVGLLWVAAVPGTPAEGWAERVHVALAAAPAYPLLLALVVPAALLALLAGRPAAHRLERLAGPAALVAALGCVAGDALLIATALTDALHAFSAAAGAKAAIVATGAPAGGRLLQAAAIASAARLVVAAVAGRRVARLLSRG